MEKRVSNRTKIVIVFITLLFFSSVFGMIQYYHPDQPPSLTVNPNLSSIGETASTSTAVNYYTNNAVANSTTTTLNFPVVENSTYTDTSFNISGDWTETTSGYYYYFSQTLNLPLTYFYIDSNSIVELNQTEFNVAVFDISGFGSCSILNVIYANISINGYTISWSYVFDAADDASGLYVAIDPQWNISKVDNYDWTGTTTVSFTYIASTTGYLRTPPDILTSTNYTTNLNFVGAPYRPDSSIPFAVGYHINPSATTSFTISQYESSFDIAWSSNAETNPQYNGNSPTGTSGTITGSLTVNSFTVYIVNEAVSGISSVSFSYYLSSQYQVSPASTTETSSPTYTYTQVSGTTNQASASFSFSVSTPSNAVFISYETATNSLSTANTNIVFTPTMTVSNPYYTYSQNQLVASISGASSGSSSTSNTASSSFTGNSVTYTSSTSPSWSVDLNLYGNVYPTISQSVSFSGTASEVSVTFTSTQPDFSGELQTYIISWGDGTTSTYSNLATGTYTETHVYSGTYQSTFSQTYDIYVQDTNDPNPLTNGLSDLTSTTSQTPYTIGIVANPTTPDSILNKGQSIFMNLTDTNLASSEASVTVNGATGLAKLIYQSGSIYDFKYSSDLFGVSAVTVAWNITSGKVYDVFSTQYTTPIEPTKNSSYITVLYSNTYTESYLVTLSGTPLGTGYYYQLFNITNPSQYGINAKDSNLQFVTSNDTLLRTWIKPVNSTLLQAWVSNYNNTSTVYLQILPLFENNIGTGYVQDYTNQSFSQSPMPTYTIGSGSVFQANSTAENTTNQHYNSFGPDSTNLTDGEYTYYIPDSFNSNYITIYYNPAWQFDYVSYGFTSGIQATASGVMPYHTFSSIAGIGTLTVTLIEPLVVGEPLGTLSLGVLPSIAIDGNGFFELPNDLLHWTANGVPVNPSGFAVVIGKTVLLEAFTGSGAMVYKTTYTPTEEVTFLQTYVNITAFQFNNLNSTDEVDIQAISNNITQNIALVGPYGTGASSQTVYLPSGNYTFNYTELNYTTGQVESGTSTATAPLANYDGEYWVTLAGLTIYQLGNEVKYSNSSIQKSIQSLSVIIALNDSAIKNLTLGIALNLTATNSSIQNVLQKILVSDKFINDTILNENLSLQTRFNIINSTITTVKSNLTLFNDYVHNTINATITNIKLRSEVINTTVSTISNNITLLQDYERDYINTTINNISAQVLLTKDLINNVDVSLSSKLSFISNLINTTNSIEYPIHLSGVPSGSGTYQQLVTIINPSKYSINPTGSNLQFEDGSNHTLLYAWEQNINSSEIQVWIKNYYGSSTIDMQVLPSFENLFSSTGYLGEAPQLSFVYGEYFNAPEVFGNSTSSNAWDFAGTSLPSQWEFVGGSTSQYYTQNNGATVHIGNMNGTNGVGLESTFTTYQNYLLIGIVSMQNLTSTLGETAGLSVTSSSGHGVGYGSYNSYEGSSIFSDSNLPSGLYGGSPYTLTSGIYTQIPDTLYNGIIGEGYTGTSSMVIYNGQSGFAYYNFNSGAYIFNRSFPLTYNFGIWNKAYNQSITAYTLFLVQYNGSMPTFTIGNGTNLGNPLLFNVQNILNIVNDTVHTLNLNLSSKLSILNSLVNNVNISLQSKLLIINTTVSTISTNLTILQDYEKDVIDTAINKVAVVQTLMNDTLGVMNNNITLFYNYEKDLINSTTNKILIDDAIINSTAHLVSTNLTFDYKTLSSLIGTNNLNVSQNIIYSDNIIAQNNLIYKTTLAIDDYVASGGTGVITTSDGSTVTAYSNILDPFEVTEAKTYSNLTTTNATIWFGNPINNTYTNIYVNNNPMIALYFKNAYIGTVNVTYYNTTIGLTKVITNQYNISGTYYPIILNKQYIADGYIVEIQLNKTAFKTTLTLQSEVVWTGQIGFIWTYDNGTKIYSVTLTNPADPGSYGTANIKALKGVFLNTTSQEQLIDVGFPTGVVANVNSVIVKDITDQYTLQQGVNYNAYTDGVEFQLNNYTASQFYIQFNVKTNVTNALTQTLTLNSVSKTAQNGHVLYYGETTYTDTGSSGTFNFYIDTIDVTTLANATVIIDNTVIPSKDVTMTGTQIIVTGVYVTSGQTITVQVYYSSGKVPQTVSILFIELTKAFDGIITPWFIGLILLLLVNIPIYEIYATNKRKPKKTAKDKSMFLAELSMIWFAISLWIIMGLIYYAGAF